MLEYLESQLKTLIDITKKLKSYGWALIHTAVTSNRIDIVKLLLKYGTDLNIPANEVDIEAVTDKKETPLILAAKKGFSEIGRLLIKHGAKVYVFDHGGYTPLQYAIEENKIDFVRLLIKADSIVNLCSRRNSYHDFYPLHTASNSRNLEIAKLLVEHGANVNGEDNNKSTPLHQAVIAHDIRIAQFLIENGADVNAKNINLWTPIHSAVHRNNLALVELLIKYKANLNVKTLQFQETPLHIAIVYGNNCHHIQRDLSWHFTHHPVGSFWPAFCRFVEDWKNTCGERGIAEILIENGADVNIKTEFGLSAIHFAMICGRKKIAQMLMTSDNFDDNVKTPFGQDLLQFAFHFGLTHSFPMLAEVDFPMNTRNDQKEDYKEFSIQSKDIGSLKEVLAIEHKKNCL